MRNKSNVTVIIPCYNDGEFIMNAINSILQQTLNADRIIVIDDGSEIATTDILKDISLLGVEVFFQENMGVCKTRNRAIEMSNTEYILSLDADDYFEPTFIEKAVEILNESSHIGVVGCFYKRIEGNMVQESIIKPQGGKVENFLIKNNGLGCSMFRRKCWEEVSGYDELMVRGYEDWDFWISILKNKWEMYIIDEPLFNYRIKLKSRDQTAFESYDFDLKNYILNKHKLLYLDNFDLYVQYLISENEKLFVKNKNLKNTTIKLKKSIDFKIGYFLLKPFRFLKSKMGCIFNFSK